MSYALDAYYRSDNGQRVNNDLEHLQFNGQFKFEITPQDTVFLTTEFFRQESGDVAQHYDPASANPGLRVKESQEPNLFLGYHREWNPNSHTLLLVGRIQDSLDLLNPDAQPLFMRVTTNGITRVRREPFYTLDYERDYEVYSAELQQIWQSHGHTVIVGGTYQNGTADTDAQLTQLGSTMSSQRISSDLERLTAYGYYQWRILDPLALTAGVTYDHLTFPRNLLYAPLTSGEQTEEQVSPKVGLIFTPARRTTVRALYAQSLGGLFNENSFRLEPTQVGGLNQSWRVIPESSAGPLPGASIETWSASLDQSFASGTFLGVAAVLLKSDGEREVGAFTNTISFTVPNLFSSTRQTLDFEEQSLVFTANQLISDEWTVGARYRVSEANLKSNHPDVPATAIWQAQDPRQADQTAILHQLTLSLGYNHRCGFFAEWLSHWTKQDNSGYTPALAGDNFWQHDVTAGYRFLNRRAEVRIGVLNLTDQDYRLNPLNLYSESPRHRTLVVGAKFNF
jgi:outer membrane receptor protein involved in Fe transport